MQKKHQRLEELIEAVLETRLSQGEADELQSIILNDGEAAEFYTNCLLDHAILSFQSGDDKFDDGNLQKMFGTNIFPNVDSINGHSVPMGIEPVRPARSFAGTIWRVLPLTALLIFILVSSVLAVFVAFRGNIEKQERLFASIAKTNNCLWTDSKKNTYPGSRLGACSLHLMEGIAHLQFDCDVVVTVEGPCHFELKGEKRCILHSGKLSVSVESANGKGFIVETPQTRIQDFGTKFAVSAFPNCQTGVFVQEGLVEVTDKTTLEKTPLRGGDIYFVGDDVGRCLPQEETRVCQLTSAENRGKEAWVIRNRETLANRRPGLPGYDTESFMLVKTSCVGDEKSDRKAIFSIDLSSLKEAEKMAFEKVELHLSYGMTRMGFSAYVADASFTVYGLTNESYDDWDEKTVDWSTFPGNDERNQLQPSYWKPLGTFIIPQGCSTGIVQIDSQRLADFIRSDTNNLVTFAVARDTAATAIEGIAHGFANRHHDKLLPPRLRFYWKNQ